MVVRDVNDVCFLSYFSVMDDLRQKGPPNAKYYEIRFCHCMPYYFVYFYVVSLKCGQALVQNLWPGRSLVQNLETVSTDYTFWGSGCIHLPSLDPTQLEPCVGHSYVFKAFLWLFLYLYPDPKFHVGKDVFDWKGHSSNAKLPIMSFGS